MLNNVSILWHAIGTTSLVIAVLAKAPTHQSAKFVFTQFVDGTGTPGWGERASHAYVAIIGILVAQYTLSGKFPTTEICNCKHTTNQASTRVRT
jgi:hypothetical protein